MVPEKFRETKVCVICNKEFSRLDNPRAFDRMVTCGNVECAGKRSRQKWKQRYNQNKTTEEKSTGSIDMRKVSFS